MPKKTKNEPRYMTIYNDLKQKIVQGTYQNSEMLPYEREMCDTYQVERVTVRRALELLVQDGLVEKRAGLGSFVHQSVPVTLDNNDQRSILFVMMNNSNDIKHNVSAFNSMLFYNVEHACRQIGYSLIYASVSPNDDLAAIVNRNNVAGVLFVSKITDAMLDSSLQLQVPSVCVNHLHDGIISVVPDNERGAFDAITYLIDAGHQRIAYINGKRDMVSSQERLQGYQRALIEHNIQVQNRYITEGNFTFESGQAAMVHLFDTIPAEKFPTAVFCASDMMALGAMDVIKEHDFSIPKDISVIGFDNIDMCNYCYPRLSTVAVNARQMSTVAVSQLMAMKHQSADTGHYTIRLPITLTIRQSTGAVK